MARSTFSQAPAILDLTLTAGDDWGMQLTLTEDGVTPINLSTYTFDADVLDGGSSVQAITVANTDLVNGVIDLSLSDAATTALEGVTRTWALTWVNGSDTFTAVAGMFRVLKRGETR